MSAHYMFLTCRRAGCEQTEMIYTGAIWADNFPDAGPHSFEGEQINVWCNEHVPQ